MRDGRIFHTLDALRGVAAFAVVCFHRREGWFPSAYLAVDLFFVLSGFVLAFAHDDQFADGLSWRQFMVHRVVRLWPLYAVGVAIAALGAIAAGDQTIWRTFPLQILFLPAHPGPGHAPLYPLDVPAWSLMFELGANAVWAVFWRWLHGAGLVVTIVAAAAGLLAIIIHQGAGDIGSFWSTVGAGAPRALFGFLFGVGLFRLRLSQTPRVTAIGSALLCAGVAFLLLLPLTGGVRAGFDAVFDLAVSPAIVLVGSFIDPPRAAIPFTRWLGAMSYPVYAVHWPLIQAFDQVVGAAPVSAMLEHVAFIAMVLAFGAFLAARYDPWARRGLRDVVLRMGLVT